MCHSLNRWVSCDSQNAAIILQEVLAPLLFSSRAADHLVGSSRMCLPSFSQSDFKLSGLSGLVASCYLIYSGRCDSASGALAHYQVRFPLPALCLPFCHEFPQRESGRGQGPGALLALGAFAASFRIEKAAGAKAQALSLPWGRLSGRGQGLGPNPQPPAPSNMQRQRREAREGALDIMYEDPPMSHVHYR